MENKDGKKRYLKIAAAAFCLVFISYVLLTVSYIRKFDRTLMEENESHLAEIANHIVSYSHSVVEDTENALKAAADAVYLMPEEKRLSYLKEVARRQGFAFAGYAWRDGRMKNTEKSQDREVLNEEFFQDAMKGKTSTTGLVRCILKDRAASGIFISVPVLDSRGEPQGVLSAMLEVSRLKDILAIESFRGEGYSYIIDPDGSLLLYNKSMDYNNLYRVFQNVKIENGITLEKVKADIKEGTSGMIEYDQFGVEKYAYYCPMGLNSWTVVNIVSKNIITQKTNALTKELVLLSMVSFSIFLFLFVTAGLSFISSQNQRHAAETKSVFLANMSHEIRTPMNVIVGMCEILLKDRLESDQEECVRNIQNSSKGLLSIINDILDFSKIESGKFTIIEEEYELLDLLEEITAAAVIRIGKKPVRFLADTEGILPAMLLGDKTRVKQILINLLGNAAKFTEKGMIRLSLSGEKTDDGIRLTMKVKDTGIGIKKKDMEKLFISFNQVDTHHSHTNEGTGLGLAISRALSQMMGGGVSVESEYGKGSVFTAVVLQKTVGQQPLTRTVYPENTALLLLEPEEEMEEYYSLCLRRTNLSYHFAHNMAELKEQLETRKYSHVLAYQEDAGRIKDGGLFNNIQMGVLVKQQDHFRMTADQEERKVYIPLFGMELSNLFENTKNEKKRLGAGGGSFTKIPMRYVKILMVDDNQLNLDIEKSLLEPYKMQIDCVTSGEEALEAVKNQFYDLVFMDHMMPGMDGVETFKAIRGMRGERFKKLPIVVLTANATSEARQMFLREGFDGFLSKPIDMAEINRVLEKWLRDINEERARAEMK